MDVSNNIPSQPSCIGDRQRVHSVEQWQRAARQSPRPHRAKDAVSLSAEGRLLRRLEDAVRRAPDVREERVAALRTAIEQGTYQPSPVEIARAMLAWGAK